MKKVYLLVLTAIFACSSIEAQVSAYTFSQASGTYTNQATAGLTTLVNNATLPWDNNVFTATLPFAFTYNGVAYAVGSNINVSSNGFITFGASAPSGTNYTPISSNAGYASAIAGIGRDLGAKSGSSGNGCDWVSGSPIISGVTTAPPIGTVLTGGVSGIPSGATVIATTATTITMNVNATSTKNNNNITYYSGILTQTTSSSPNRKFYIQWSWTDAYIVNALQGSNLNFQIVLNETSNDINVIYGSSTPNSTLNPGPGVGLRGTSNADFNDRTGSNWSASTAGGTNASVMTLSNASTPASGQTYTWTQPPVLSATALTAFGAQCINTTLGPNSFTITGTNLTATNVTVGALSGYTYSSTSGGTYTTSLSLSQPGGSYSQQIFVQFSPTSVLSYNGNMVLGGGGASSINEAVSGSGVNSPPTVTAGSATGVTINSATVPGTITSIGCSSITVYGVEYSLTSGFANGTGSPNAGSNLSAGNFSVNLTGLSQSTIYYYHTFATNAQGTAYSSPQGTLTTLTPTLTTSALTAFGAQCINNGIYGPGSFTITGTNLTTANVTVSALSGYTYSTTSGGTYTTTLSLIQPGGSYSQPIFVEFTPIAIQSYNGNIPLGGGGAALINALASASGVNSAPTVTTSAATSVTINSATIPGVITVTGCTAITAYGVEYSTSNGFANGTGTQIAGSNLSGGNFSVGLTGLTQSTTYYYHAVATNGGGTGYSAQGSFITLTPTLSAGALTAFGAQCINNTYGPNSFIITGTNLTTANVTVAALSGYSYSTTAGGTYTTTLSLVQPGGSYSQQIFVKFTPVAVQSYPGNIIPGGGGASNINVTASGSGINTVPGVTSGSASSVTSTSATIAGTITSNGCTSVTSYGVEYSTSNGFANGTGTLVAGSNLSGAAFSVNVPAIGSLNPGTTYYFHAYATNGGGTGYGVQGSFLTIPACATLVTPAAGAINITTEPGSTLTWSATTGATSYDVYFGTTNTPPLLGNAVGTSTTITGILSNTTYYWYVSPRNSSGAATGCISNIRSFTTAVGPVNDECSSAISLSVNAVATPGTTVNADQNLAPNCSFSSTAYDVWYKFTAINTSETITLTCGSGFDGVIETYSGTCGSFVSVSCRDNNGAGVTETLNLTGLTTCNTYYIRVYGFYNGFFGNATGTFTIKVAGTSTLTVSTSASSNLSTVCNDGVAGNISLTTAGGSGGTITWYTGSCGGTLLGTGSPLVIAKPLVTTTYFARRENSCDATACVQTIVTVNPVPTAIAGTAIITCSNSGAVNITAGSSATNNISTTWTSSGTGTFVNANSLSTATYTPGAADIAAGSVILTLTASGNSPCGNATSTKSFAITKAPVAVAGTAVTTCFNSGPVNITGGSSATNQLNASWTSDGSGIISNASSLTLATYTPSSAENTTGANITLTLTVNGNSPCGTATSSKSLLVSLQPTVSSGTPVITCGDAAQTGSGLAAVNITAGSSATNQNSVAWTSNGGGTIQNSTSLTTATYTPTAAERTAGSTITLTLTAFGNSPCGNATSTKTFTITPAIDANAGNSWKQLPTCSGLGVQFTLPAAPSGGNGTLNYQWMSKNNCGVAGTSTPVPGATGLSFTPTDGNCYWLFISSGGCSIPQSLVGGTTRQSVSSDTAALANINLGTGGSNPKICVGGSATLTASSKVSYTYSWSPSTGLSSSTGATVTANPASTTIYTVTATATDGSGCTKTAKDTVTVYPVTVGGLLPSVSSCSGGTGTLILTGNVGNVIQWENSTNNGGTWAVITNTTTTLPYTVTAQTTLYRALVQSGSCSSQYSSIATVGLHNVWTGVTSTDWFTTSNWSDGQLPTLTCPTVTIPQVTSPNVYPVLNSGAATINNLLINANASLTVSGVTLQIAGSITSSGIFDVSNGVIELNGSSVQSIPANVFATNTIKGLIISNNVSLDGQDSLTGTLSFGASAKTFTTNGNLILKSTIAATASVSQIINGNSITGDVTVERYIATGPTGGVNHGKTWQLLATPTFGGQTIKESWQEGASVALNSINGNTSLTNPHSGYGTMLTSAVANAANQSTPGFDAYTAPGPSIKTYNSATNGYDGGPANTSLAIYNQKGYMILVRGDRSVYTPSGAATPTVLRTKGTLFTPLNPPHVTSVMAGKQESMGNPYASAIDMRSITKTGGVNEFFYVWDPRLGSGLNLGAFQTFLKSGSDYIASPGGGSYGPLGTINNYIQSGQAFIVAATTIDGTVTFKESDKAGGSSLFSRPSPLQVQSLLQTGLYVVAANGSTIITDGVLNSFDDAYSNAIDGLDARKSVNNGENLSIRTAGQMLSVERKHTITRQDTIFLNLTGMRVQQYQFQFTAKNIKTGVLGFLEDNYLHTQTPVNLSGSTVVNFSIVNIAGSYAPDRFRIVFAPAVVPPVTFTSIKAYSQDKNINIEWIVENEMNIKQYEVEKSINGTQFTTLVVKEATANDGHSATYVATDASPMEGTNYYRVKSVDVDGKTAYSDVVKVLTGSIKQDITIYPNPVTDGAIHLQLTNQPEGKYGIRLMNKIGQVMVSKQVNHSEGSSTELIKWDYKQARGMYQLEVTKPDGTQKNISVIY